MQRTVGFWLLSISADFPVANIFLLDCFIARVGGGCQGVFEFIPD